METLFVLLHTKVICNGPYQRIVFLDAYDMAKLDRLNPNQYEQFVAGLKKSQVRLVGVHNQGFALAA